jgi:hypothetical protein
MTSGANTIHDWPPELIVNMQLPYAAIIIAGISDSKRLTRGHGNGDGGVVISGIDKVNWGGIVPTNPKGSQRASWIVCGNGDASATRECASRKSRHEDERKRSHDNLLTGQVGEGLKAGGQYDYPSNKSSQHLSRTDQAGFGNAWDSPNLIYYSRLVGSTCRSAPSSSGYWNL